MPVIKQLLFLKISIKLANNQNEYIVCLQEVSTCIRHAHFYDTWKLLEWCLNAAMAPIINAHGGSLILIYFPKFDMILYGQNNIFKLCI